MSELLLRYLPLLFGADAALVVAHLLLGRYRFWDLDKEHNLPSWYSGVQLLLVGLAALDVRDRERRAGLNAFPGPVLWGISALAFAYLSLDEITVLHESYLRDEVRALFPSDSLWISILPWQIVLGPFLAIFAAALLALFVTRLALDPALWRPAVGGLGCWVGAVVVEALAKPMFMARGAYRQEVAFEEGLEMLGATLLIVAFARYGRALSAGTVRVVPRPVAVRLLARAVAAGVVVAALGAALVAFESTRHSAWIFRHEGRSFAKRGACEPAIVAFRRALAEKPSDVESWRGLARCQSRLGDADGALAAWEEALRLAPEDSSLWHGKAVSLHRLERLPEAEAAYREAVRLRPRYAKALANLGLLLERQDRVAEARGAYEEALGSDPSDRLARRRLHRLVERSAEPRLGEPQSPRTATHPARNALPASSSKSPSR